MVIWYHVLLLSLVHFGELTIRSSSIDSKHSKHHKMPDVVSALNIIAWGGVVKLFHMHIVMVWSGDDLVSCTVIEL